MLDALPPAWVYWCGQSLLRSLSSLSAFPAWKALAHRLESKGSPEEEELWKVESPLLLAQTSPGQRAGQGRRWVPDVTF